jgi:hypothetical protein
MVSLLVLIIVSPLVASAQHHKASPPAANIDDRKISLNLNSQPSSIIAGQNAEVQLSLDDENAK